MESFLQQNQMYIVLIVVLLIWTGIVSYLWRIDRKVNSMEKHMKKG